ncbi:MULTISPECIES: hypothetical protein [unclassified Pseudoalteromonas]|uniref:hypothetical protein n=1 Tax=unclassified Pseudoalteromonas TaxID=194690 RepID=UPI00131A0EE5|nr:MULTISPECIES: hypothetical protein [unclassified Pseudoalteromonas]
MMKASYWTTLGILGLLTTPMAMADEAGGMVQALKEGQGSLDLRYRYEFVDQDGKDKQANASTLRTRLGYQSGVWQGFQLLLEVDDVTALGNDNYNSTFNQKSQYPVVADPQGTEINRAQLAFAHGGFKSTLGRQRIIRGNSRFIGNVGWRQNEQTYDALSMSYQASDNLTTSYAYIYNVNRIFGPDGAKADLGGDLHLLDVNYAINKQHSVQGFYYDLGFDKSQMASRTLGIDYSGQFEQFALHLAYAYQSDGSDNLDDFSNDYIAADASYQLDNIKFTVGGERLSSDNGLAFQTPLATLHKFNGFADVFLTTPADGLEDLYVTLAGKVANIKLSASYHDYSASETSQSYGSELNVTAVKALDKTFKVIGKLATYDEDGYQSDRTKVWLMIHAQF